MDNINVLPLEILERILSYLNFSDRKTVRLVCSYWRQVLHGVQFQRRCRISICRTFNRELPDMEMRVTQSYRNISLNQWSDSDDEDDEQCTNEDITNLKYLFEPCPENNIKKLLFQRFDLEALALYSSFGSSREILEKQLSSMTNLRELELTFCKNRYSLPDESVWVIHHDKLETLKIDVTSTKPFKVVLSRLKKLELLADCSYSIHIIQSHCWQLQDLKIYFQDPKTMDDMMSLSFPVLTNLEVYMFADKDVQLRYARIRNEFIDREKEENFIKSMPKLKSLLIESNLMFYRIQMALTKHGHQLEKLTLASLVLDAAQLLWIEKLPKIKTVILQYIAVPASQARLAKLHMPHLHHLALLYNKSYIGFDNGLIGLKSLKLTVTCERNQTILHQICNKLPNLEQLELFFYCKLLDGAFRYLDKLKKLKILQITDCDSNTYWTHCPVVPNLRRVAFDNCRHLRTKTLQPIAGLFPGLVSIYLDRCIVTGSDEGQVSISGGKIVFDETEVGKRRCYEQLKSMFPQCIVSLNETVLRWKSCD